MKGVDTVGLTPYAQTGSNTSSKLDIRNPTNSFKYNILYPTSSNTRGSLSSSVGTPAYINTAIKNT